MTIISIEQLAESEIADNNDEKFIIDCGVDIYALAGNDNSLALDSVIKAIALAGELENKYREQDPARHSKASPHKSLAVLIRAGKYTSDSQQIWPGYQMAMNNVFMALETLVAEAERAAIWLLIENPAEKLLISPLELRDLVDELRNPWLAIYFNPDNVPESLDKSDFKTTLGSRGFSVNS